MQPRADRPAPLYMQVAKHIRSEIESGTLKDGDRIDSSRTLSAKWGISLATAVKAVGILKAEGLVHGEPGIGTVVSLRGSTGIKGRVTRLPDNEIPRSGEHIEIQGAELTRAPGEIAKALGLPKGHLVIRRHWITFRGDSPVSASTSWFTGELAKTSPRLLAPDRFPQGISAYIEETSSFAATAGKEQVRSDIAEEEESRILNVPLGSPVLRLQNWVYDTNGKVIEFSQSVSTPLRWSTFDYKILR